MTSARGQLSFELPELEALFVEHELSTVRALCESTRGELVTTARTRTLRRVALGDDVFYIKTQDLTRSALPWRKYPSYAFRGSPITREARAQKMLAAQGFRVAPIVAHGAERGALGLPARAALVTRELPGWVDLRAWCESARARDDRAATRCFDAAEELLGAAHERGLVLLGAKYRNLLLPDAGLDWERAPEQRFALIDQPSARRSRSARLRAKDWKLLRADRARYGRGR